ncbi:MAG: hypothetical protein WBN31_15625 [Gammaproteobacteria bacterium]
MKGRIAILFLLALGALIEARAEDTVRLETSTVTGNRELPKVMVIVPWKKAAPGDIPGRPVESLLDEAVAPVEREVFRLRLTYYRDLDAGEADNIDASEEE